MAKGRHVFVCKDGSALPEWLKLPGRVECVVPERLRVDMLTTGDMLWLRLPSSGGHPGISDELVSKVSRRVTTIIMTDIPDDDEAIAMFSAGARGYCNSHSNSRVLKLIAKVVQDGGLWIGESLMQRLVVGVSKSLDGRVQEKRASEVHVLAALTDREREVAEAIAGGASNKDVARLLDISERAVKAHLTTLFNKLGVRDRLQLTIKIKKLR